MAERLPREFYDDDEWARMGEDIGQRPARRGDEAAAATEMHRAISASLFEADAQHFVALANPTASTKQFSVQTILDLHSKVLEQEPESAGVFRTVDVFVNDEPMMPPEAVPAAMDEFVRWLNEQNETTGHVVEFAVTAHRKLVAIHPFVDGNGRVGRLLLNLVLNRRGLGPVLLGEESRDLYYDGMEGGDMQPLISQITFLIGNATEK